MGGSGHKSSIASTGAQGPLTGRGLGAHLMQKGPVSLGQLQCQSPSSSWTSVHPFGFKKLSAHLAPIPKRNQAKT